jgi:hypothetical protein
VRAALALSLALLLPACGGREAEPPPPPPSSDLPSEKRIPSELEAAHGRETGNLLNIAYGAAVVSRTAELTLDNSALRAIDGDADSMWATPPRDYHQTLVFSLGAPARIEQVGVRSPTIPLSHTSRLSIELSADGTTFTPAATMNPKVDAEPQLIAIAPREARFVRVTTHEGGARVAALQSVHVRGSFLAPPTAAPLTGCWAVNGALGRFSEKDGRVYGEVDGFHLDGALSGGVYRFAWNKGPNWGYALATVTPDGQRFSGITWYEEAAHHSFGTTWFGERSECDLSGLADHDVAGSFLRRAGWYPLFSLRFDARDALIVPASSGGLAVLESLIRRLPGQRLRLLAREFHEASPDANRTRAVTRLESLRSALRTRGVETNNLELVPLGSGSPRRPTATAPMRQLYSVVEIEVPATVRSEF